MTVREIVLAFARNEDFRMLIAPGMMAINGRGFCVSLDNDSLIIQRGGMTVKIMNKDIKSLFMYKEELSVYIEQGGFLSFKIGGEKNDK